MSLDPFMEELFLFQKKSTGEMFLKKPQSLKNLKKTDFFLHFLPNMIESVPKNALYEKRFVAAPLFL